MLKKPSEGWFAVAQYRMGTQEFYLSSSPFRNRYFLWSVVLLIALSCATVGVIALAHSKVPVLASVLMAYSLFELIFLSRIVFRSQQALHLYLTSGLARDVQNQPELSTVLGVAADVSNWALVLSITSAAVLLMAIIAIVRGH
jgi:hypothetical protein